MLKYRYVRSTPTAEIQEHISDGRQVRYRMLYVNSDLVVEDVVSRWTDTPFEGATGRISGVVLSAKDQTPLPNILIACGGVQTLTSSDGSFLIEGLLPGVHNLVAYSLDGQYKTFQQGARVAADSTTPATIQMEPAKLVGVVFTVKTPANTIPAVPLRLAGNLYQLGNTFADLQGGVSTIASRMPAFSPLADGRYSLTVALPAGADVHYVYTLGDGFWNTEVDEQGIPVVRQFIVPEKDTLIEDTISNWRVKNAAPIAFDITVPENTPQVDFVSIQLKPVYGWTEPIPMWRLGNKRWGFILNSPLTFTDRLHYRFCRNDQCGQADSVETPGPENSGLPLSSSLFSQTIKETVPAWAWLDPLTTPQEIATAEVQPRQDGFFAGIEYQPIYHPSYNAHYDYLLDEVQQLNANWLILTPTWTFTRLSPPILELVPGNDPLWLDLFPLIRQTAERGLNVALFPQPRFRIDQSEWWQTAPRDFSWWQVWFERYRNFALYHADLASKAGANALILGGEWLTPAYPEGILPDYSPSLVPKDSEIRWRVLIQELRSRFNGPIIWAISVRQAEQNSPPFLGDVDAIYLLWSEPLANPGAPIPSIEEMTQSAGSRLDTVSGLLRNRYQKAILLGISYPSSPDALFGCIAPPSDNCQAWDQLAQPLAANLAPPVDLQAQVTSYNVMLGAINNRTWIHGFVSRGFYPPAALMDASTSIHGKPTATLLTYWFEKLLYESEE
ncbi:MAG: hypothetical protein RML93_05375 [Anaerolineales bacterium]|nr:hypothetical protein [Anaerolineales bacterium]MDW8446705.1 hypothetical protein [Anaerolineales bacterium]